MREGEKGDIRAAEFADKLLVFSQRPHDDHLDVLPQDGQDVGPQDISRRHAVRNGNEDCFQDRKDLFDGFQLHFDEINNSAEMERQYFQYLL